jgi:hypothetical protein
LEKTPITAPEPVNAPIVTCILANREPDDTAWKIAEQLYLNVSDTRPYFGDALPDTRARYTIHGKGSVVASPPLQINTRTLAATQIAYQYGTRFGRSNSAIDFTQED